MKDIKINIGVWTAAAIIINAVGVRIFLNYPRAIIEGAGNAGWIQIIYASGLVMVVFTIICSLYSKFQGKDLIDIGEYIGGSTGRILVGIPIIAILLLIGTIILREFSENMKIISLPISPINFVMLFFCAGMITGAYLGLEAIVRFHAIVVPIIITAYLLILLGVNKYYDVSNFYPIFGKGLDTIFFTDGFLKISLYSPILYLFLMVPFLKTHKNFKTAGFMGISICAILLLISALSYIAVFQYNTGLEQFLPTFELARLIAYGRFFQRIESIFLLTWASAGLMYLSVILFFLIYSVKKTFKLEYHRPLILPFAVIIYCTSLLPKSLMSAIDLETKFYPKVSWIITFALPLLILILSNIKKSYFKGVKNR